MSKFENLKTAVYGCAVLLLLAAGASAADPFREQVQPFLKTYCYECHNDKKSEGELNLAKYTSTSMLADDFRQWEHVVTFLKSQEMPPAKAKQPMPGERDQLIRSLEELMLSEARKLAGDPGVVLPRRLSNAEYNYTIRDLTGFDIRPADSFPIDPASGEGFSNTGEALLMSPSLFKKYYAAAQFVADHVDFTPTEWAFAPYPVATYADQKKLHEQNILNFYTQHRIDYESCLTAAWTFRCLPPGKTTLEDWAVQRKVSPKYLRTLWELISADPAASKFYVRQLRQRWQQLTPTAPTDNPIVPAEVQKELHSLAADIQRLANLLCIPETAAIVSNAGNAPIQHIERRQKSASSRDTFNVKLLSDTQRFHVEFRDLHKKDSIHAVLRVTPTEGEKADGFVILKDLIFSSANTDSYKPNDAKRNVLLKDVLDDEQLKKLNLGQHPLGDAIDPTSFVMQVGSSIDLEFWTQALPKEKNLHLYVDARLDRELTKSGTARVALLDQASLVAGQEDTSFPLVNPDHPIAEELREGCQTFCHVFPNRFYYVDETRGLSAGFHLIEGFFRDDQPLCKSVLNEKQNQELDRLWDELAFGTQISAKMLRGFVFFERSERNFMKHPDFDSFKEEDPELTKSATVLRLEQAYFDRTGFKGTDEQRAQNPIHTFFTDIRVGLEQRASRLNAAQAAYVQKLEDFAEIAYRRPLTETERQQLRNFYQKLSNQEEFGIEKAIRASIVRLLVSPNFCYRIDPSPEGQSVKPLTDLALALRLSYFLWSSQPDAELLAIAKAGKLHEQATLREQTRRMLKDPKISGFALEFFGQWLRYRDFLEQESVSRQLFPDFDGPLKQAIFEEPSRLTAHLIQQNRPMTDLLNGDVTLVNKRLAQHYGVPFKGGAGEWTEITGIHQQGRSGLLGMAVFLTKNSQPQRTSPVKRGFWVVHHLLGEHIPPPPADVVALPAKETDTNGKTIRQLLASHTEDEKCARCHQRFDSIGLSMEGFDAIGRSRSKDLAGRPIDNLVQLPSGAQAHGIPEYSQYLAAQRADEFSRTLCRKLLGYALGRSLQLSDQPLLDTIQINLKNDNYRFGTLFETVVTSPQFRNQRCRDFSTAHLKTEASGE